MQDIKLKSRGSAVAFLQELFVKLEFEIPVTSYFGTMTETAVMDFQSKNRLVIDGGVGIKTWTVLLEKTKPAEAFGDKFLDEQDLIDFFKKYDLELAAFKAVNEVESSGKVFLSMLDQRFYLKDMFFGDSCGKEELTRKVFPTLSTKSYYSKNLLESII
jgi:hypothetical protein